jgi:4-amino-4-deoxy-L-arabinose transferase-like glycosyltransferase
VSAEPASAPPSRRQSVSATVAIVGIVLAAAVLRLAHNRSGVPYAVGVDEPYIMDRAVNMMRSGDFNPHFFDWPSLTIYLHFVVACGAFLAGAMQGAWGSLDQVTAADFYVAGRSLTAVVGAGTVLVLWLAARRWGVATGLIAAGFLAIMPNHVRESHFTLTDVPTGFFTTLTLLLALRASERPTRGAFVWAGLAAGLAASCKYNGLVAIVMPLIAAVTVTPAVRDAGVGGRWTSSHMRLVLGLVLLVFGCTLAGFLIGTPYALLDLPKFLNDYARLALRFSPARPGEPGWSLYLKYLEGSLYRVGMILAGAGLLVSLKGWLTGPDRTRWLLLFVFPLVYFKVMASAFQIFGRYTVPLLPSMALLAAVGVVSLWHLGRRVMPARIAAGLAAALIVWTFSRPLLASINWLEDMSRTSTADQAYNWIVQNVPRGTKIAIETGVMTLPGNRYPTLILQSLTDRTYDQYVQEQYGYLLASASAYNRVIPSPEQSAARQQAYKVLFERAEPVAEFDEAPSRPGPTLRIFRIRP